MTSKIKIKIALLCSKFGNAMTFFSSWIRSFFFSHLQWKQIGCYFQNKFSSFARKISNNVKHFHYNTSGSILLEVAIGLSVLSIVSGFFITKTITVNRSVRIQKTKNNIEIVTSALAAYLASNNRLPRPSSDNNGLESSEPCGIGTVPYNTLGIPQKNSLDGDSHPLIYIADINLTHIFSSIYETELMTNEAYFCKKINNPQIKITSQSLSEDVVAFAIDTLDNKKQIILDNDIITIKPSANTFWIRRNMLLIQYIKCGSCESKIKPTENQQIVDPLDMI